MADAARLLIAAVVTLVSALVLRRVALRFNIVDKPGPRKIHSQPVPYLGGVAVLSGVVASTLFSSARSGSVLVLLLIICGLGLFDDLVHASVPGKLIIETSAAVAAAAIGFSWHVTDSAPINFSISVVWIVGLTNSFNLLDNMDGLSSTAAAVSALAYAVMEPSTAPLALAIAGAAIAFLWLNRPPARMYLGDAGSLVVGFTLGLLSIRAANGLQGLHSAVLLVGPVALAVFDTSLVIVSRLMTGRPVQLGGRDHFSHRLRQLGWTAPQVLLMTAVASGVAALVTFLVTRYPAGIAWLGLPLAVAYASGWVSLLRVDPYADVKVKPEVLRA
jgi:UDP-GlcNAc:undecaprenyl-phosphate GlcNAc-1-phosphate transferase